MSDDRDGRDDYENDPFDDELSAALMAAAELVVHTKKIGLHELEFPLPDDGCVWVVNVRKLGIRDGEGHEKPPRLGKHDGTTS